MTELNLQKKVHFQHKLILNCVLDKMDVFSWQTYVYSYKTRYCEVSSTDNPAKQEAHKPHRSPEQQFIVTFYFVVYAISLLNFKPLLGSQYCSVDLVGFNKF